MPVITPETVCVLPAVLMPRTVPLSATLFAKVPLFPRFRSRNAAGFTVTALTPERLPGVPATPPTPICRMPPCTVVGPLYVLLPARICVLRPSFTTLPSAPPPMTPKNVTLPAPVPMVSLLLPRLTKDAWPMPGVFALARDWMAWFALMFSVDGAVLGVMDAGAPAGKFGFAAESGSSTTSVRTPAMPPSAGGAGSAPTTVAFSVPPLPIHVGPEYEF